ncbi:ComEC/Rec2 family competence protein [Actinomyces bowdenii]|uniref:ComEC/Rec2 family competence protein n=1 Tax=Actinomyces bowdenii TaxID=131109 RepID=A0A3P1UZM8_9ACTO|nr:ComEC/Rec2 family competence protein [Actinomyces bowdenii]
MTRDITRGPRPPTLPAAAAPWDDPAVLSALAPSRRGRAPARTGKAPEALDLRLLPPALSAWAAAFWAVGQPAAAWGTVAAAALACLGPGILLAIAALRFRPPRHRADDRPGAPQDRPETIGSPAASLLVCLVAICGVLAVSAAQMWSRGLDPLTAATARPGAVTLLGTVAEQPRVSVTPRATTVITILDVESVDGRPSRQRAIVLAGQEWARLDMGDRVRVRASPRATEPGRRETALIGRSATVRLLEPASGALGAVTALRRGLARAVGAPTGGTEGAAALPGPWPRGSRELVPGVALGDDHALPAEVRQDMRTVSMTHLTAVSGQHVAIVLGLCLAALGVVPRRWRALVGALLLAGLVILVRPSGSVLRSAAMGSVMLLGVAAGRRAAALPSLCAAILLLLLADPWQSRDYGFALSVSATAGILLGQRPMAAALSRRLPRWAATALALPLVAQAACAPILILLQPSAGAWSVPANVLAAPVVPLVTVCGILATLIAPLWPAAAGLIAWPATAGCAWLVAVAGALAHLPGARMPWPAGITGALAAAGAEAVVVALAHPGARRRCARLLRRPPGPGRLPGGPRRAVGLRRPPRGRLVPWHRPDPRAPEARAAPAAPAPRQESPGTRPSSPR